MNGITLYSSHMKTLSDLQTIAEKHGAHISIDYTHHVDHPDEVDLSSFVPKDVLDDIRANFGWHNKRLFHEYQIYLFSLYDKDDKPYSIQYLNEFCFFDRPDDDSLKDETIKWLDENEYESSKYFEFHNDETIINGFEKKEAFGQIYREGIALAIFARYVFDFFGEPEIKRTY